MAVVSIVYPTLSRLGASDDIIGIKKVIQTSINIIIIIIIPLIAGAFIFRVSIVRIIFEHGQFNSHATLMTADALLFFLLGALFIGVRNILERSFYSIGDVKTPMVNGIAAIALNIILGVILAKFMASNGLALATSISAIIAALHLFYKLRKRFGPMNLIKTCSVCFKSIAASFIMAVAVKIVYDSLSLRLINYFYFSEIIPLTVSIIIGVFLYFFLISIFKIPEWVSILNHITKRKKNYC
jgi:putative peptidoglycan lipid II flippase